MTVSFLPFNAFTVGFFLMSSSFVLFSYSPSSGPCMEFFYQGESFPSNQESDFFFFGLFFPFNVGVWMKHF